MANRPAQLLIDQPRIQPFLDRQDALDDHFAAPCFARRNRPQLGRDREEDQVGRADAVDGRDERDGDARPQLGRIGQVLHHVDQSEHRAENAHGRRIAARRLEHARRRFFGIEAAHALAFEHRPDRRRRRAVDGQRQAPLQERIVGLFDVVFQLHDAFLARFHREAADGGDHVFGVLRLDRRTCGAGRRSRA